MYFITTKNTFEMILWSHSLSEFFANLSAFRRCTTDKNTYLHVLWRVIVFHQLFLTSATNYCLCMRFNLLLSADSPYPCRMSWKIIKKTIVTWIKNIVATLFPQSRSKIIGKGQQPKSRRLQLQDWPIIITATNMLGFRVQRRIGLVSDWNIRGGETNHYGTWSYCVLCKKAIMPEKKYMLQSSEDWFCKRSNQNSIRYGLGVPLVSKTKAVR